MARSRVYRHDIRCPHCGSNWIPRHGLDQGRQVYRCGDCGRRHIPDGAYRRPSPDLKAQALEMYGEGSSRSAIGRLLGYSATAVQQWVKKGGSPP